MKIKKIEYYIIHDKFTHRYYINLFFMSMYTKDKQNYKIGKYIICEIKNNKLCYFFGTDNKFNHAHENIMMNISREIHQHYDINFEKKMLWDFYKINKKQK